MNISWSDAWATYTRKLTAQTNVFGSYTANAFLCLPKLLGIQSVPSDSIFVQGEALPDTNDRFKDVLQCKCEGDLTLWPEIPSELLNNCVRLMLYSDTYVLSSVVDWPYGRYRHGKLQSSAWCISQLVGEVDVCCVHQAIFYWDEVLRPSPFISHDAFIIAVEKSEWGSNWNRSSIDPSKLRIETNSTFRLFSSRYYGTDPIVKKWSEAASKQKASDFSAIPNELLPNFQSSWDISPIMDYFLGRSRWWLNFAINQGLCPFFNSTMVRSNGMNFAKGTPIEANLPLRLQLFIDNYVAPVENNFNWGNLAADAYGSNDFWDGNGIAYFKDLTRFKKDFDSLASTIGDFLGARKPVKVLRYISNLFLSFHYGWKLFAMDTQELADALREPFVNTKRCQAQGKFTRNSVTFEFRYQVFYEEYGQIASELEKFAQMFDLLPDLSNVWDMVPYSFVVDWISNIGDILTSIDGYLDILQKHEVIAVGKSCTATYPLDDSGEAYIKYYHRSYSKKPVEPSLSLSVSVDSSVNQHLIEAGALITSRF